MATGRIFTVTHNGFDGIAVYSAVRAVITQSPVTWNGGGINIYGEGIDGPDFFLTFQVRNNTTIGNAVFGITEFSVANLSE